MRVRAQHWLRHLAVLLLVPLPLRGEVRSSTSYTIEAETFDGAGGTSTSANYAVEDSLEPVVAGGSFSTNYAILHGFVQSLTIVTVGEYDNWAQMRGLTPGVDDGFFDDPNLDGRPNLIHFAFDTDPLGDGSSEDKRRSGSDEIGGMDYYTLTVPMRAGAVFGGDPLVSNSVDGIVYTILGDADLQDPWSHQVVEVIPALDAGLPSLGDFNAAAGGDWQYRTFRATLPISASPHYFMKVGAGPAP